MFIGISKFQKKKKKKMIFTKLARADATRIRKIPIALRILLHR